MSGTLKPISKGSPPPVKRRVTKRKSKYDPIVAELQADPGVEYLVLEDVTTSTARVLSEKGCDVHTRTTGRHNRVNVWASWPVGKSPSQDGEATSDPAPKRKAKSTPVTKKVAAKAPVAKKAAAPAPTSAPAKKRPARKKTVAA